MTMQFTNLVKAQITQSLVKMLFERAGYRVTRLGVEELFTEITYLDEEKYKALNLPLGLRYLPDLLVADRDMSRAFLVEVKFRKDFNETSMKSLHFELKRQREYWPDSYAVILIANSFVKDGRFHQDYIRTIPPEGTEALNLTGAHMINKRNLYKVSYDSEGCEGIWDRLPYLTVFDRFRSDKGTIGVSSNADLITSTIRDLKKL